MSWPLVVSLGGGWGVHESHILTRWGAKLCLSSLTWSRCMSQPSQQIMKKLETLQTTQHHQIASSLKGTQTLLFAFGQCLTLCLTFANQAFLEFGDCCSCKQICLTVCVARRRHRHANRIPTPHQIRINLCPIGVRKITHMPWCCSLGEITTHWLM